MQIRCKILLTDMYCDDSILIMKITTAGNREGAKMEIPNETRMKMLKREEPAGIVREYRLIIKAHDAHNDKIDKLDRSFESVKLCLDLVRSISENNTLRILEAHIYQEDV